VGVIGDQTYSHDLDASYETLRKAVEILRRQNVAVVLHTGDLIESTRTETQIRSDFQRATSILDSLQRPWHLTPGDHDVNAAPFKQDSSDRSRENLYRDLYRARVPEITDSLDHSFNVGSYHFIALNSQRHLHTDPRWGNVFLAKINDEQVRWLAGDLEANRRARGVVVFLHQPLWYNWGDWTRVHELLRKYRVAAVIAGHFHYSQDEGTLDGIRYVVAGAAGGNTKNSNPRGATSPQIMVVNLNGRNASFQALSIEDGTTVPLIPRQAMDRLQALDIAASQVELSGAGQVCLPARLSIAGIGNPLDVPVRVHIESAAPNYLLRNSQFAPESCFAISNGDCVLRASDHIAFSNTSSVQLDNRSTTSPLWTTEVVSHESTPKAGDAIRLKVRLSFDSPAGELFIEHLAAARTGDCK
jgi:predicted phosphodiesterase